MYSEQHIQMLRYMYSALLEQHIKTGETDDVMHKALQDLERIISEHNQPCLGQHYENLISRVIL